MILFVLEVLHSHVVEPFLYSQSIVLHRARQDVNRRKDSNSYGVDSSIGRKFHCAHYTPFSI